MTSQQQQHEPKIKQTPPLGSGDHPRQIITNGKSSLHLAAGGTTGCLSTISPSSSSPKEQKTRDFDHIITYVTLSPDGQHVALSFDQEYNVSIHPTSHIFTSHDDSLNDNDDDFGLLPATQNDDSDPQQNVIYGPRLAAPIRRMSFSPDSRYLAVASEDSPGLFVISIADGSSSRYLVNEANVAHDYGGCVDVSYNPAGGDLVSLGMDGRVCFWKVEGSDPEVDWELAYRDTVCVGRKDLGMAVGEESRGYAGVNWSEGGDVVGIPGSDDLMLRKKGDWKTEVRVKGGGVGEIDGVVFEREFVLGVGKGGVGLWNWKKEVFLRRLGLNIEGGRITDLTFIESFFMVACADGVYYSFEKENMLKDEPEASLSDDEEEELELQTQPMGMLPQDKTKKKRLTKKNTSEDIDDDDMFDDDPTPTTRTSQLIVSEAEEDDDDDDVDVPNQNPNPNSDFDNGPDQNPNPNPDYDDDDDSAIEAFDNNPTNPNPPLPTPTPHLAPFLPSSTPIDQPLRILCWNHIGLIKSQQTPTGNDISITFRDAATRRAISFPEDYDFIMGSLGDDGAVFASGLVEEESGSHLEEWAGGVLKETGKVLAKTKQKGSTVHFHRYETLGSRETKDWSVSLEIDELALGCASGEGWAGVITSLGYLRLFSTGGVQGLIVHLPGDPISIVGRDELLAVVFDKGGELGYWIWDVPHNKRVAEGILPGQHRLDWLGFSNEGVLLIQHGNSLSMLISEFGFVWVPVLDLQKLVKAKGDSIWPVYVEKGTLVGVPLRGGDEYPDVVRRPITGNYQLRMPVLEGVLKERNLEEVSIRASTSLSHKKFMQSLIPSSPPEPFDKYMKQIDKLTLKLFISACQSSRLDYALDLAEKLHLEKSLDVAIDMAETSGFDELVDEIEMVRDRRFSNDDDSDDVSLDGDVLRSSSPTMPSSPVNRHRVERRIREEDMNGNVSSPPPPSKKFKSSTTAATTPVPASSAAKRKNPFAIRTVMSPGKKVNNMVSPPKIGLSRMSTFSARSREESKEGKTIL